MRGMVAAAAALSVAMLAFAVAVGMLVRVAAFALVAVQ